MVLFQRRVGRARVGLAVVEQRFDGVAQAALEQCPGFGIELAVHAPHARVAINPGAQAGVAALLLKPIDALVGVNTTNFGPHRAGKVVTRKGRRSERQDIAALDEAVSLIGCELAHRAGDDIDLGTGGIAQLKRDPQLRDGRDRLCSVEALRCLGERDPTCIGGNAFGEHRR